VRTRGLLVETMVRGTRSISAKGRSRPGDRATRRGISRAHPTGLHASRRRDRLPAGQSEGLAVGGRHCTNDDVSSQSETELRILQKTPWSLWGMIQPRVYLQDHDINIMATQQFRCLAQARGRGRDAPEGWLPNANVMDANRERESVDRQVDLSSHKDGRHWPRYSEKDGSPADVRERFWHLVGKQRVEACVQARSHFAEGIRNREAVPDAESRRENTHHERRPNLCAHPSSGHDLHPAWEERA